MITKVMKRAIVLAIIISIAEPVAYHHIGFTPYNGSYKFMALFRRICGISVHHKIYIGINFVKRSTYGISLALPGFKENFSAVS